MYMAAKHLHMTLVALSVVLLIVRFMFSFAGSDWWNKGMKKALPHIIDTGLLASAIWLCVILSLNPFSVGWLTEKIIPLVVYIVIGTIALKHTSKAVNFVAMILALLTIATIAHLAINKQALLL